MAHCRGTLTSGARALPARPSLSGDSPPQRFFVEKLSPKQLRAKFEKSFKGFDDADMAKVEVWNSTRLEL